MGDTISLDERRSDAFLARLYDAHPERALNGFRPRRVGELEAENEQLLEQIERLKEANNHNKQNLHKANVDVRLLQDRVNEQQKKIDQLIANADGNLVGGVPTVRRVVETVAQFYGVRWMELCGVCRTQGLVRARHVAIYLARELTGKSFPIIGRAMGGRDHSTTMHGHGRISEMLLEDDRLRDELTLIKLRIAESNQ